MGGLCVSWFTTNHPEKVRAVAPISPVVSGGLFSQTDEIKPILESWRNAGMREWESSSRPGLIKRLKYDFMKDAYQYDLLKRAGGIRVPVLIIVGDKDETTPLKHQNLLFNALNTEKELHIIKGAGHTFKKESELNQLEKIISKWIKQIN